MQFGIVSGRRMIARFFADVLVTYSVEADRQMLQNLKS